VFFVAVLSVTSSMYHQQQMNDMWVPDVTMGCVYHWSGSHPSFYCV